MLLLGLGLAATHLLHATTEAPITGVTVYSDMARVVRTASVQLVGTQRLELPRLPDFVDPNTIQVEAQGAEVSAVDIRSASAIPFPYQEARKLLATLDGLDDAILRAEGERAALALQLSRLRGIQPVVPAAAQALDARARTSLVSVAPAEWAASATFLLDVAAKLEMRMRELGERVRSLNEERGKRLEESTRLGALSGKPGIEVGVSVTGTGQAKVRLSYLVARSVRWYPRYELQLQPEQQRVQVALSGLVSQDTGEDWDQARLTLSTALPSTATALPRLSTWKIGTTERFLPTPWRKEERASTPPPLPPRSPAPDLESALRRQLLARAGQDAPSRPPKVETPNPAAPVASRPAAPSANTSLFVGTVIDAQSRQVVPDVVITATSPNLQGEQTVVTDSQGRFRIPDLPSGVYVLRFEKEQFKPYARSDIQLRAQRTVRINVELLPESLGEVVEIVGAPPTIDVGSTTTGVGFSLHGAPLSSYRPDPVIDRYVGLAPPPGWTAPTLSADLPASLAGGYALDFTAPRLETVPSGQGERTVPLLIESWPVQVERHVFPALASETYLVAQLKSPSRGALPGGEATLFVGADPAGSASLKLIVPGEPFTLPLGVDPAVRAVRNVRLVQSKDGFISKDEVNTYEVTVEVPNPYPFAMQTRVVDQWPLSKDSEVEVKLVRTEPAALQDPKTGELRWDLLVPASSKTTITFEYTLRRPQNWRLSQSL